MGNTVSIGNFKTLVKRVTPVCDTSAYTAGDVLFPTTAIPIATNAQACRGTIRFAGVLDKDDGAAQTITLWFLRSNVAFGTANAAISITDANAEEIVGKVSVTTSDDLINSKIGQADGIALPFELSSGTLYVAATTAGTPTQTASGIVLRIGLEIETPI